MFEAEIIFGLTVFDLLVTLHLVAVVIGAGAAFMSDFLFNHHMQNRTIETDEYKDLRFASTIAWIGLMMMFVTGLLIFLSDIEKYSNSSKFIAKMIIVVIITINGMFIHAKSIPLMERFKNKKLLGNKQFFDKSRSMFWAGGISGVSWMAAIFLGSFGSVEAEVWQIMAIYVVCLGLGVAVAELVHNAYLEKSKYTKK